MTPRRGRGLPPRQGRCRPAAGTGGLDGARRPGGWDLYRELQQEAAADPAIKLFTNLTGVGNIEVNAFQRLVRGPAESIREGFGLVVSESLWKGTPVIAGRPADPTANGRRRGGVLVDSTEAAAKALVELLADSERADELGRNGRERVHEHFLLPRLLLNELVLLNELAGDTGTGSATDPVCGLVLDPDRTAPAIEDNGIRYEFCSDDCRRTFITSSRRRPT